VAEAVSSDNENLFVVNQDDNTIVQFVVGSDGKVYPFNTVNTPGIYPLAVAVNKSNLFVLDTYEPLPLCSSADPCPGSVAVYPLTAGGASASAPCTATVCLGAPLVNSAVNGSYWPLTLNGASSTHVIVPTAVNVLASGDDLFVAAYDSSVSPSVGYVFGFSVASGGALSPLPGSPFAAGVRPSAIASDLTSTYVYVTDSATAQVLGYSVASGSLAPLASSPYPAGSQPSAIVIDPTYPFAYVANAADATVEGYSMSNGGLTSIGTFTTGVDPVAIGIDPSTNHFLYTVDFLGNTVSDFELSTSAGTLIDAQFSPYPTAAQPVAVAAVPHNGTGAGIHATAGRTDLLEHRTRSQHPE
jgi:6-phosphogluconolactonase (cycloisomerase 2 family)